MTGRELSAARIRLGLTVAEWARMLHVSEQSVYRWERGDVTPTSTTGLVLSRVVPAVLESPATSPIGRRVREALQRGEFAALVELIDATR